MRELGGLLFLGAIVAGLAYSAMNLRAALRNPKSRDSAQGALLGALIGWIIGGR